MIPHDRYFQACDFVDRGDGGGQGVQTAWQGHPTWSPPHSQSPPSGPMPAG